MKVAQQQTKLLQQYTGLLFWLTMDIFSTSIGG